MDDSIKLLDEFGGVFNASNQFKNSRKSIAIVTLVLTDERGAEYRYYLPPLLAAYYLTEVTPFTNNEPRIVKARIVWGSILDNWTY